MLPGMTHVAKIAKPAAEMSEDEFDAWMEALPPAPGIRHVDDGDDEEDDAAALADLAAGRCYDHAIVGRWLLTAGEPDWKPFEEWLAEQGG